MPDREKVIKGLELLKDFLCDGLPGKRVVFNSYIGIANDAIALLKGQQEVVRCKDCKHRPKEPDLKTYETGFDLEFPDERCPCKCSGDGFYSWYPDDNWFCGNGERKE